VGELVQNLFEYGTASLDRVAFQKALDDIGAREQAGVDFSVEVLSSEVDRGVQLLADNELHPAMPESAFGIVKGQIASEVHGQLQSPDFLTKQALAKLLFPPNDPALRHPTPQTIAGRSLTDVRNYYARVYRPDLTTIVVIGEMDPKRAHDLIEKYFGSWKAEGTKPPVIMPPVPPNKMSFTVVPDASRVQDRVILAETLGLTRSNPDYYALQLGNHVLGGGFYATRLYRDLRENGGLVYTVASSFDIDKSRGVYRVSYACDPQQVFNARGIVERDLRAMQVDPVTSHELTQAKAMLLREIPLSESSVHRIASGFISRTSLDLPLNEPTLAAERYLRLTAEDVKVAFSKWIRVKDLVQVTEGPQPKE
jgi:zinc protease